jgi:hypothetical protein
VQDWSVSIQGNGPSGSIKYQEGQKCIRFYWEFGGRNVILTISGPPPQRWDQELSWTIGRRLEILERVASDVIRQQTLDAFAEFTDGDTTIVLRNRRAAETKT